ncbi:MAG: hypothetical protein RIT81_24755 [Deltaproteobacteria bacterium]
MQAAVALTLLVASSTPHEVPATDRRVLPVVLFTVTDTLRLTSRTDLLRRLDDVAQAEADLTAELMPTADPCTKLDSTAERFKCIAAQAGRDERSSLTDEVLIISVAQTDAGERFSALLLDWRVTNQIVEKTELEKVGSALRRRAIVARSPPLEARIPDDVQLFVSRLFTDTLRARFREAPYGVVELVLERSGCELRLDGQTLGGLGDAPITRIVRVPPGRRQVEVQHPAMMPVTKTLVVEEGGVAQWRPDFVPRDQSAVVANQVVRWTGIAAGVTGAAIGIYALVSAPDDNVCFEEDAGCPDLGAKPYYLTGQVRYSSVAVGLSALGVTAAVSNWLLAENERFPWLEIGLAVAAGAVGWLVPAVVP